MTDSQKLSEQALIDKIKTGSQEDFGVLYERYFIKLTSIAYSYTKQEEDAKDIVQAVFIKFWEEAPGFSIQLSLKAYLYRMTVNASINYMKKIKYRKRIEIAQESSFIPPVDTILHYQELSEAIIQVVQRMPERRKTVFVLHYQHDLSYQEISQVMKTSVSTVRNQISQALKNLKDHLNLDLV